MPDGTNLAATTDKRLVLLIDEVTSLLKRNETSEALGLLANCRTLVATQAANGQALQPSVWEEIESRIQMQRQEVLSAYATVAVARDSLDPDTQYTLTSVLDDVCARLDKAAWAMDNVTREAMHSAGKATPDRRDNTEAAQVATIAAPSRMDSRIEAQREEVQGVQAVLCAARHAVGDDLNLARLMDDCFDRLDAVSVELGKVAAETAADRQKSPQQATKPTEPDEPNPQYVARLMNDNACRVHEALAVLRLASNLLMGGPADEEEQSRAMSAIDAAERVLEPLTTLGDEVELKRAVARLEAKDEAAAA